MSSGAQYVVAAYAVIAAAFLLYLVVAGLRTARIAREAELLARLVDERAHEEPAESPAPVEVAEAP